MLISVPGETLYNGIRRKNTKLIDGSQNIFAYIHGHVAPGGVFLFQSGAADNVEQMDFNCVRTEPSDFTGGSEHHFWSFAWQTVYDMYAHSDTGVFKSGVPGQEFFITVAPVDLLRSGVVNCLQTKLNSKRLFGADRPKQFYYVTGKAIRTGGHGQSVHPIIHQGGIIQLAQYIDGSICI